MPLGPASDGDRLLRTLHDEHGAALWRYALSLTGGDAAQAQDVVQETLLRAWRNPNAFEPERGSARAWLYTVARRIVIDDHRSARRRHESVTDHVPEPRTEDAVDQIVDREVLRQALSRLTPEHREVLRQCYYRGRSVAEAAEALSISPGTVKSRTHYAIRALRAALQELGGAE
ncbi:RNA polymerase sigma factor [Nocardioides baekrokdamisoli]|uniref:RNA polymerase sigma factor n=1 Tax=Nocardioides baekrokdamisoli TaxID=1804624 RepID=A0A3G9IJW6_9ACTN|nr:sigma-70 family RNA polymerase sigma factor [Nocardioides baekrokdamisoli]BBH18586.1 RNA polymerase sigma factor [Nocardioides baekrokdamisoli]